MFCRKMIAAAILTAISSGTFAAEETQTTEVETVTVKGQRSYNAHATEKNQEYTSPAATVGTKIPASMREIPQSISIITNQQIKDRNVDTFDQLARKTPGLRVLSNDDGRSSVYARGYEYDEYNVDGLPAQMQSINGTLPNLFAFDRVEVMRGPSGLFDNSGEMGGIVNLVRKRPTKEFQGHIGAGSGTDKQYRLEGDVSGRLNDDGSIRGRAMAQTFGKSPEPAGKNNHHETVYTALDWDINPDTTLGFGYLYQQRHLAPDNGLPAYNDSSVLPLPQNAFVGAEWNRFHMKSHDVFADLKHYFDNGGYGKIGMRYSDRQADSNYAFSGSALNADNTVTASGLGTDIGQKAFAVDASYSQSFALGKTANEFVVGADYNRFQTSTEQGRTTLARNLDYNNFSSLTYSDILGNARSGIPRHTYSSVESTLSEAGIYGKTVFRPVNSLALIVGGRIGRYDLESKEDNGTQQADGTKFTGYAGAVWDFTDTDSLYASYSMLHRPQTSIGTNGKLLKPRKGTQFEFGHKGSYLDEKLNTRLTFYRLQDKNAAASIPGNPMHYAASGKRVMQGVEAEISGAITPKWNIHAGYSYLHSDIKTESTAREDGVFLLMPKHSANLWTTYAVTDKFTIGGGLNTMSQINSSANVHAGGFTTFDAMASYQFTPKLKVQINADNIFNRKYYTRVGNANTFNIPGAERSLTANLRYQF